MRRAPSLKGYDHWKTTESDELGEPEIKQCDRCGKRYRVGFEPNINLCGYCLDELGI